MSYCSRRFIRRSGQTEYNKRGCFDFDCSSKAKVASWSGADEKRDDESCTSTRFILTIIYRFGKWIRWRIFSFQ